MGPNEDRISVHTENEGIPPILSLGGVEGEIPITGCTPIVKVLIIYNMTPIHMPAIKRIPVSEEVWKKLGDMKGAGQTYDDLLEDIIERAKKSRLEEDVRVWESTPDTEYVPLPEIKD